LDLARAAQALAPRVTSPFLKGNASLYLFFIKMMERIA
jgi:hypothetical protein